MKRSDCTQVSSQVQYVRMYVDIICMCVLHNMCVILFTVQSVYECHFCTVQSVHKCHCAYSA